MSLYVCPMGTVAAPVETVWELLEEPALFDLWWDARTERIVPEGKAIPGQVLYAKTPAFGRQWAVTLTVMAVDPTRHQIHVHSTLPLGVANEPTITCTPIDATSCRVQFG